MIFKINDPENVEITQGAVLNWKKKKLMDRLFAGGDQRHSSAVRYAANMMEYLEIEGASQGSSNKPGTYNTKLVYMPDRLKEDIAEMKKMGIIKGRN